MEEYVTNFEKEQIGYLEFGNPAGNSLPSSLLIDIEKQLELLSSNNNIKVIVIQSAGKVLFAVVLHFQK